MKHTTSIFEKLLIATNTSNASELAERLNITSQAVSKALKNNKIPTRWVKIIASETQHEEQWFYDNTRKDYQDSDIIMIPMVEARLSAGGGSFETSDCLGKEYSFRRDFLTRKGNPKNMTLMRVSGDSMTPEIMDNDVVLIDQSKTDIIQGKMFAVGFEDCIYLKRIDLLPGKVILKSTNLAYPPIELELQEDMTTLFRVIGKVLWCGREYL